MTDLSELLERAEKAEEERDALLAALGIITGPLGDELRRKVILDDAAGLRPEMVRARQAEKELISQRDWDRLVLVTNLRTWVHARFGIWITWRTATKAAREILPIQARGEAP